MLTVEKIIAELKIGGYLDAAEYVERLSSAAQKRKSELDYMKKFIEQSDFTEGRCRDWLRALWTTYCLHYNLDVDTAEYDSDLSDLWYSMEEGRNTAGWSSPEAFSDFMCEYLV